MLAQNTGEPIDSKLSLREWPWTWVRVFNYVLRIKSVYERAAISYPDNPDLATPLRWVFFDDERLEKWFDDWKAKNA